MLNKERKMKNRLLFLISWFFLLGCTPIVETDINSFMQNPRKYEGKKVVIVTTIKDIQKRPDLFIGKEVKIKGFVRYLGFRGFPYWNFIIKDKEGNSIRCYEREYRIEAWIVPVTALRDAQKNKDILVAVGRLKRKDLLELDWIEYKGQMIDTDFKPVSLRKFF